MLKKLADREAVSVASQGASEGAVTTYDNFEQVENVKAQRVDDNSSFHSVTTRELLRGADIPPGGLRQEMLDSGVRLTINECLFTPGNRPDELENQVSFQIGVKADSLNSKLLNSS